MREELVLLVPVLLALPSARAGPRCCCDYGFGGRGRVGDGGVRHLAKWLLFCSCRVSLSVLSLMYRCRLLHVTLTGTRVGAGDGEMRLRRVNRDRLAKWNG